MNSGDLVEKFEQIVKEKEALTKQCKEMEEFLQDYGLKWLGKGAN